MTRDDRKAALTEVHQLLHEEYHEMTHDDIIRLAREAGFERIADSPFWHPYFERFAALVAAAEREEILKLADSLGWVDVDHIRARGENK